MEKVFNFMVEIKFKDRTSEERKRKEDIKRGKTLVRKVFGPFVTVSNIGSTIYAHGLSIIPFMESVISLNLNERKIEIRDKKYENKATRLAGKYAQEFGFEKVIIETDYS